MCSCYGGSRRAPGRGRPSTDGSRRTHRMSSTLTGPARTAAGDGVPARGAPRRRTRVLALPEARWAAAALGLFLAGLPVYLLDGPAWAWGALFAATYVTGGWEPGWAGLKALM